MTAIEARGLRKAFGTTIALDGVDLRVEEGRDGSSRQARRGNSETAVMQH
ncbi:MAG TPA: hypothetical protein VKU44_07195 [Terriglobia bacterium]|nr:hypothetical protein [Terriglobia bacterium]